VAEPARIERNLQSVRERIAGACRRVGRDPEEVTLVAVTKTEDEAAVRILYELGVRHVGENRVQDAVPKAEHLGLAGLEWHFIGHLQRNKVRQLFPLYGWLHSLDSLRLAREIEKRAARGEYTVEAFLEVKTSEEESKLGAGADEARAIARSASEMPHLYLRGLMTMAPFVEDAEEARPYFRALRELRDRLREEEGIDLPGLSMGMSNDFEIALEEGATHVRVGSALFA
jgi:PLP dependent protein